MYHAHFGLQKALFGDGIAADTAVFRCPKHDQLIANFKVALAPPSSVVTLRGPAGVGKTTLTSAALRATSTRLALAWLNATPTNATELLELILVELGIGTPRTTRIERLQLWRQFQAEMSATASRVFVIAERAEDLSPEVMRALDSLTCADAAGHQGANVVLLGGLGLDAHLAVPALDSLRQRIRLRAQLEPFTEAELQDYLRHQVACSGGHYDQVFAPGTVAALHRYSGGVARVANNLCETALELAASQKHKLLTAELLGNAAVSLLGLVEAAPASRASAPLPEVVQRPAAPEPALEPRPTVAPAAAPLTTQATAIAPAPIAAAPAQSPAAAPRAATLPAPTPPTPTPTATAAPPAPAPDPMSAAVPQPVTAPAAAPKAVAPSAAPDVEFDGGATDITDVSMTDFPVLTDAVELPIPQAVLKRPAPIAARVAPQPAVTIKPAPTPDRAVAPPFKAPAPASAVAAPAPTPTKRLETAYTAPKGPPAATPPPAPPKTAAFATPAPAERAPPADPDADDVLRQTQTMRAISVAKSIDDISSSMAETLFGDAELDLLTAAFASAAEWQASEDTSGAPELKPAPAPAKAPPVEDPFDALFDLGSDAPLELIDDSGQPPADRTRKTATQR